jgi:hypothetical protein
MYNSVFQLTYLPMEKKTKLTKITYVSGIIFLIAGVIDPMEGSVAIAAGSILIAIATYFDRSRFWEIFMVSTGLILFGVFFIFLFSALGGIGGKSHNSIWWGLLMVPYPAGWLLAIILLIARAVKKPVAETGELA